EVLEAAPPGLDLVVPLHVRVVRPGAVLVVELHGARPMHLVAHEAGMTIDQVHAAPEAILEVDLVSACDGNAIGDDDHDSRVRGLASPDKTPRDVDSGRTGRHGRPVQLGVLLRNMGPASAPETVLAAARAADAT